MKKRDSSVELLRLIGMFAIVLCHISAHGIVQPLEAALPGNSGNLLGHYVQFAVSQFFVGGGTFGNDIFMLISAFYLIRREVNFKRIFHLAIELLFYNWLILIIVMPVKPGWVSKSQMLYSAFPMLFGQNWFISCYIIFSFFVPFLNKMLNSLSQGKHRLLVILSVTVCYLMPALSMHSFVHVENGLDRFLTLYIVGAYLGKYGEQYSKKALWLTGLASLCIFLASVFAFAWRGYSKGEIVPYKSLLRFVEPCYLFLTGSLLLLIRQRSFSNRYIDRLAKTTTGIFIIHESFIYSHIWVDVFKTNEYLDSRYGLLLLLGLAVAVFFVCAGIDLIRDRIFTKLNPHLDKAYEWISGKLKIGGHPAA